MNELFKKRFKEYFGERYHDYLETLNKPCTKALFINDDKLKKSDIFDIIDFHLDKTELNDRSFYYVFDNIGHHRAYELGLVYPQEPSAAFTASFPDTESVKLCIDMCAAPGGKSINILNRLNRECILISNEFNYKRAAILSSNIERCGLNNNVIITSKSGDDLERQFKDCADLIILDAPCSGEGMIRKFPEIMSEYNIEKINECVSIQKSLLENAYKMLKNGGQLLYSTCTYAYEEDEEMVLSFLDLHSDMKLANLNFSGYNASKLDGTIKLSPLNNTEGQFIALLVKEGELSSKKLKAQKTVKNKLVDDFVKNNLILDNYYLYCLNSDTYYLSLIELPKVDYNILKYGIELGKVTNNRFEPSHSLYRTNALRDKFRYHYELDDNEYNKYIAGLELESNLNNGYYLLTYKGYSVGFGKCANNRLKNKYPKGLRQML